ncbi:MAG: site-specific DNA-methyltransferase [Pseudoalteromonas sp.]|nr:site-specific DNA-methyltransferase [Pseudoalteromonas sp.]
MLGDCLERMKEIPSGSVDMILTDPPYGTTACKWDSIIPLEPMWEQIKRIIKPNGAIAMTASQPFTSKLISSNYKMFKYELIWLKDKPTDPLNAKKRVMKYHENICIFYGKPPTYNPQKELRDEANKRNNKPRKFESAVNNGWENTSDKSVQMNQGVSDYIYPKSVKKFNMQRGLHPTQKPIKLMEYLIKTYTNESETVLDFTMGSGSTGVAAKNLNRKFIGIELSTEYFEIAKKRINN